MSRLRAAIFTAGECCGRALVNVSVSLAAGLAQQGHAVDLVTLQIERDALLEYYRQVDGAEALSVIALGVPRLRSSVGPLARLLRARRPQVLFSQSVLCNAAAVLACGLARSGTAQVLVEGTPLAAGSGAVDESPLSRWTRPIVRSLYPRADGVVAKSPQVLQDLRRVIGPRADRMRIAQLPNPYAIEHLQALAREKLDGPWAAAEPAPLVLAVGRLVQQKAFDVLLHAFARVRAARRCRLLILGEGPQRTRLLALVDELGLRGDVGLPGRVENPWKYMRRADVFALPSRREGWCSALTEAAVLGCPIAASTAALSGADWLQDGKSALLVPAGDAPALGKAITTLLDDASLRERVRRTAQTAAQAYDHRRIAAEYARFASGGSLRRAAI